MHNTSCAQTDLKQTVIRSGCPPHPLNVAATRWTLPGYTARAKALRSRAVTKTLPTLLHSHEHHCHTGFFF